MNVACTRRIVSFSAAAVCLALVVFPARAEEAAGEIERWIAQLDSGSFAVRRAASRRLRQSGHVSIGPLVEAAESGRPEVARRVVGILDELCRASDAETEVAARSALVRLAASTHPHTSQPAAAAMRSQTIAQQRRAVVAIRRLGGEVTIAAIDDGEYVFGEVVLSKAWTGGEAGLEHLAKLVHVQHLLLHGAAFSDDSLDEIRKLSGMRMIRLYATEVSDQGEASLRAAFPSAKIDRRRGAMLGVSGSTDPRGCKVEYVLANGAAQIAGIETGDIITRIGDEPVADLPGMIAVIAKYKAGQRARVEFLRGDESLSRDVEFGEMPIDAFR